MNRTILTFGILAGAIVSGILTLTILLTKGNQASLKSSFDWGMIVGYASMLLAFCLIFVGIRSYRDRYQQGRISFGQALALGLGITLIASIFYTVTWVVLYKNVVPDYPQEYTRHALEKLRAAGKSSAEITATARELTAAFANYDTWYVLVGYTLLEIFPVGLLVSLLSALVLKRKAAGVPAEARLG